MLTRNMKGSGIEWIGDIPEDWEVRKLKYILTERNQKNSPVQTKDILSLSVQRGVFPYSEKTGGGNKAKDDLTAYKVAYPNDIVINSMNILAGAVGLSKYFGAVSPVYYTLYSEDENINIEYYYALFLTSAFQKSLLGLGNGIMMKESENGKLNTIRMRISMDKLSSLYFPLPSIVEQNEIVNFIGRKLKRIDSILKDTQQSITELKKYKQSLITETVTKGLDKTVEMKDSGIEWIGEVPKHWKISKMKYNYHMNKGLSITKENLEDAGVPVISYGEIHSKYGFNFDPKTHYVKCVNEEYLETAKTALISTGDFIYADTSEDISGTGNFTCFIGEGLCFAGYHTIILKAKAKENYKFYSYLFESTMFRSQIQKNVKGIKVFSITQKILKEVYRWSPTNKEQQQIVEFLDNKTSKIDSLISDKEKMITEYEAYKKSLIYEYVTGKKQV